MTFWSCKRECWEQEKVTWQALVQSCSLWYLQKVLSGLERERWKSSALETPLGFSRCSIPGYQEPHWATLCNHTGPLSPNSGSDQSLVSPDCSHTWGTNKKNL